MEQRDVRDFEKSRIEYTHFTTAAAVESSRKKMLIQQHHCLRCYFFCFCFVGIVRWRLNDLIWWWKLEARDISKFSLAIIVWSHTFTIWFFAFLFFPISLLFSLSHVPANFLSISLLSFPAIIIIAVKAPYLNNNFFFTERWDRSRGKRKEVKQSDQSGVCVVTHSYT